ncbi:MAG: glycosyltransferase family 4 protein, partial [Candidatus Hadarchaeum sp.]
YVQALAVLRSLRVPVMIRAETTDVARQRSHGKALARAAFLRAFYSQCMGFLAIGHNSRLHYLAHGVPPSRIGWAPYCIDTELFGRQMEVYGPQRSALRKELGFDDDQTVFLYVGKLIPVKDPLLIPAALAQMATVERLGVGLVVVGDGELREAMENQCRSLLGDRAAFAGFVNQNHLGRYYAMADCLVLPSQNETWGLVVNEALQFGLPALVSDGVGCYPDLIVPEKTGLVFRRRDPEGLLLAMRQIRELLRCKHKAITSACQEQVSRYSSFAAVEGICHAVKLFEGIQAQQRSIAL